MPEEDAGLPNVIFGGDLLVSVLEEAPNVSGFMAFVVVAEDDSAGADEDTGAGAPKTKPLVSWLGAVVDEDTGAGTANSRLFLFDSADAALLSATFDAAPKADVGAMLKSDEVAMELEVEVGADEVALLSATDEGRLNLTLEDFASCFMPKLKPVGAALEAAGAVSALLLSAWGMPNLKPVMFVFATSGTSFPVVRDEVEFVIGLTPNKIPVPVAGVAAELDETASVFAGMPKVNPVLFSVLLASAFSSSSFLAPVFPKPNVNFEALLVPKLNLGTSSVTAWVPGFACSQQTHLLRSASFLVIQASHSHLEAVC